MKNKGAIAEGGKQGMDVADVAGIPITHPAKLWFPEERVTKLEVAQYYSDVAPRMLPWLSKRLLTAERCPDGITAGCFFEKNLAKDLPAGVPTCAVPAGSTGKIVHYVVGGAKETLLLLVNLGCVAIHIMNCETGSLDRPDWLAFDLDPSSGQFRDAAKAAVVLRKLLEELGIRSFPKTTGGRGLHVLVPLRRGPNQEQVRLVARSVSQEMARRSPTIITVEMRKAQRQKRVFADWLRNAFGQTIVAPYSVRCRPGAPVSTPLHWDEVSPRLDPSHFNIRTIPRRLEASDPWADVWQHRQVLPNVPVHQLNGGHKTLQPLITTERTKQMKRNTPISKEELTMYETMNDLPGPAKIELNQLMNQRLADTVDLQSQLKRRIGTQRLRDR